MPTNRIHVDCLLCAIFITNEHHMRRVLRTLLVLNRYVLHLLNSRVSPGPLGCGSLHRKVSGFMKLACFWLLVSASRSGQCQAWHGALLLRPSGRTSERMFERGYGSPGQESNVSRQFTPFCFATPFSSHVLSARLLRCRAIRRTAVF